MANRKCEDCKSEEATFKVHSATLEKLVGDRCIPPYCLSMAWTGTVYPAARARREVVRSRR